MLQIEDTIISLDLIEEKFICDIPKCLGACCIEGESGAPLEQEEVAIIEDLLPEIIDDLSEKSKEVISKEGVATVDQEGDLVTSIVNGKECVFTYFDEKGICNCAIEKAFNEGKTDFRKPISCYLYPVRIKQYKDFRGINIDKWDICKVARELGKKEGVPVYKFLEDPLIRKFGQDWYDQLCYAANNMDKLFER